jgi:hypothetical protein
MEPCRPQGAIQDRAEFMQIEEFKDESWLVKCSR